MKLRLIFPLIVIASTLLASGSNPRPFTVPEIQSWSGADGNFFVTDRTTISFDIRQENVRPVADKLAADIRSLTGYSVKINSGKSAATDAITLKINKRAGNSPEAYTMNVTDRGISIESPSEAGLRHGAATLLQILELQGHIPAGKAVDSPAYSLRGLVIDAGRKFIPLDYLRGLANVMAYYKMNTLHIHLNDNGFRQFFDNDWDKTQAAFRMECESFPGLTAADGHYSKKDFRDFILYAAARGVEVIPEIDFPAHSLAFTRYMPEIGSTDSLYGRDHLDLESPQTYRFLDTLLAEYIGGENPVFAGPRMHIGTDEYSNRDSLIVERFRSLTDRYIRYVESFGKQAVIWGSLTHAAGTTPVKSDNVLMYSWSTYYADPFEMLKAGYRMVSIPDGYVYIVPEAGYYYDYLDPAMLYSEWSPALLGPDFKVADRHPGVEGGMFAVWNDHPGNGVTVKDIHHRIMHALPAMSAKTWSGENVTVPYPEFESRASLLSEAPGINILGRYRSDSPILELPEVTPGAPLPLPEIGFGYTVEFDIDGAPEPAGTALFESPDAVFWLCDPISGQMGFSREGTLVTFRHRVKPGEKTHVKVTGDNKTTTLYINGKLVDRLGVRRISFDGGKHTMAQSRTLVFPLCTAGRFNSAVTGLCVKPYIDE